MSRAGRFIQKETGVSGPVAIIKMLEFLRLPDPIIEDEKGRVTKEYFAIINRDGLHLDQ